jgi:hypothetical protein
MEGFVVDVWVGSNEPTVVGSRSKTWQILLLTEVVNVVVVG